MKITLTQSYSTDLKGDVFPSLALTIDGERTPLNSAASRLLTDTTFEENGGVFYFGDEYKHVKFYRGEAFCYVYLEPLFRRSRAEVTLRSIHRNIERVIEAFEMMNSDEYSIDI